MADYDTILSEVLTLLEPLNQHNRELSADRELVADLGLDSVKVMELLLAIEDRFDISIPLNILPDVRTVHDLCIHLEKLTAS